MSLSTALESGRSAAESLMEDTCTIAAPDAQVVYDAGTDSYIPAPGAALFSGKCRFQSSNVLDPRTPELAGREVTTQEVTVSLPMSATGIPVGAVVTCTAAAHDPDMVGRQFTVEGLIVKTHATARRLRCEAVVAP